MLGELISAGGNIANSVISSALSYKYSKKLMEMQQNWQERMSNTSHQRETADLRAAGLNPILSANGGSSWGAASGMSADVDVGLDNAVSAYQQFKTNKLNQENLEASTAKTISETQNNKVTNDILTEQKWQNQITTEYQTKRLEAELQQLQAQRELTSAQAIAQLTENPYIASKNKALIHNLQTQAISNSASAMLSHQSYRINKKDEDFYNTGYGRAIYGIDKTLGSFGSLLSGSKRR